MSDNAGADRSCAGCQVTVELKNDLAITGTLHSVDQYLNVKLNNVRVVNEQKYPHMVRTLFPGSYTGFHICCRRSLTAVTLQMSVRNCFIRGSVVRYVQASSDSRPVNRSVWFISA